MGVYIIMLGLTGVFLYLWERPGDKNICISIKRFGTLTIDGSKILMVLSFLPMFAVNSLMYYVGNDYKNYAIEFNRLKNGGVSGVDYGYLLINKLVIALNLDFQFVYIICCAIGYVFLMLTLMKCSKNIIISYVLYFSIGYFFLLGMNQLRQFVAVMIIFYAYQYILQKNFLKYFILIAIASLFHFTAIVMILFYFILKMDMKASYWLMIVAACIPFNLFYNKVLTIFLKIFKPNYIGSSYADKTFWINNRIVFGALLVVFIIFFYYDRLIKDNLQNKVFINAILFTAVIYVFCGWLPEYERIAYYIYLPMICLVPNALKLEKNNYVRVLFLAILIAYYWLLYLLPFSPEWGVFPYASIFTK